MSMRTKLPVSRGVAHERLDVRAADVVAELQADSVGLTLTFVSRPCSLDRVERVVVGVDDLLRLLGIVDLLAEDVDRRGHPVLVQLRDGRDGVVDLLARDVAIGDPPDDRTRNRRQQ